MFWLLLLVHSGGVLAPWGVRTLPDPAGGHWLRWEGAADVRVDGVIIEGSPPLHLAPGPHAVRVGDVAFSVAAERDPCLPLRFVVLGDGRAAVDGVGPSAYWPGILREALAVEPAFVLNTGDLVKNGQDPQEWPPYLRSLPPWPPVLAVRGNHDRGPLFDTHGLGLGDVFTWRTGPVLVAGLNTEVDAVRLPALAAELDAALAADDAAWKVVFTHRPVWSRGNHGSDERDFNQHLVPVFEKNDVAVVFSGHDHDYERFCPSIGTGAARHCDDGGVTYIVTGGAATFTVPIPGLSRKVDDAIATRDDQASRAFSGAHHFVEVRVDRGVLRLTAHRTRTGNVRPSGIIDEAVLTRPDPPACQRQWDAGPP